MYVYLVKYVTDSPDPSGQYDKAKFRYGIL